MSHHHMPSCQHTHTQTHGTHLQMHGQWRVVPRALCNEPDTLNCNAMEHLRVLHVRDMCVHACARTHAHTHAHMHTCAHVCVCVCVCVCIMFTCTCVLCLRHNSIKHLRVLAPMLSHVPTHIQTRPLRPLIHRSPLPHLHALHQRHDHHSLMLALMSLSRR